MLRRKEKGQSLVEFALILPVFLLLLLGIIEASRVIWAYITVQSAAREAARYAITGRPYSDLPEGPDCQCVGDYCHKTPTASTQPWVCAPSKRVEFVKEVALDRARTLSIATECTTPANFDPSSACARTPGAFGVLVVGQEISPTVSLTSPIQTLDHPGTEGLLIQVRAFYNVQMIDPIFDTLMGGNFIQVKGELEMQNEGIDVVLGSVPPPAIGTTTITDTHNPPGTGPNGEQIWSVSGYTVDQGTNMTIHLESHFNLSGPYDIYLSNGPVLHKICSAVNTGPTNAGDFECFVPASIPPGFYDLFSTLPFDTNPLATAPSQVEVKVSHLPQLVINNGDEGIIWAANSLINIGLIAHQVPDQPFDLYFEYGGSQTLIAGALPATTAPVPWQVLDLPGDPCPIGGTPCKLVTRKQADSPSGPIYAETDLYITRPEIVLAGGEMVFAQGETMYVFLRGHTPGQLYDLKLGDGGANTIWLGRTDLTDSFGNTTNPENWTVLVTNWPVGMPTGWPDGTYEITSHPVGTFSEPRDPATMDSTNQIANLPNVQILTPAGPYITVDGGYTWPINSFINIKVHKHPQAGNPYYLKFGDWRVPITGTTPVNTFDVDAGETAVHGYRIPLTATTTVSKTFAISSFNHSGDTFVAEKLVRVFPVPVIRVLEGTQVLPDAQITIQLTNHSPNSSYRIIYANKLLGQVLANASGQAQLSYDLSKLPGNPPPDFSNPANLGLPFEMYSQQILAPNSIVATTTLTLDSADLQVTAIQFPPKVNVNTTVPVTVTVRNIKPITISRYFDTDLYMDPSPLVPSYQAGRFNFPGDVKLWKNNVPPAGKPGDTFSFIQNFFVGDYGQHRLYGYADTSNFIRYENSEVNNILNNSFNVTCTVTLLTDTFTSSSLAGWTTKLYGVNPTTEANPAPQVSGGRLNLTSDGRSTTQSTDEATNAGHLFFHKTTPFTTETGLDVRVQILSAPNNTDFAKAGLQLRNSLDANSAKIEFSLTRRTNNRHRVQVTYRSSAGTAAVNYIDTAQVQLSTNPVWLRIQRLPGSNTFNFYYVQQSAAPTNWGAPYATVDVGLNNQLYLGLFNTSNANNNYQTSQFDNFTYPDPASCPLAAGQPDPVVPPGMTLCTDPLVQKNFDRAPLTGWILGFNQGVAQVPGSAHSGNFKLMAPTFDGQYFNPFFYQKFRMPSWVISSTSTLDLSLFRNVDPLVDGNDPNDRFFVVVATGPSLSSTLVTSPTQVANGDIGGVPYSPVAWQPFSVRLPLASGINLENYEDQDLYLFFYNNSNKSVGCPPTNPNCYATKFYFDDISLTPCTTEPLPSVVTTHLKGKVVLHHTSGGLEEIPGVKVWAYAENGQLYETFTIQNGEFNFYNLPATAAGTKYFIYAEHNIIDALNPSQVETLAANVTAILKTSNGPNNPLVTRLDLYSVGP